MPADLKAVLDQAFLNGAKPVLSDEQEELFTNAAGVAPGLIEIFATVEQRDAALGPCAPYAEVVPANPAELMNCSFDMDEVAVGHRIGEPNFETVLEAKVVATVRAFAGSTAPNGGGDLPRPVASDRTGRCVAASPVYGPRRPTPKSGPPWLGCIGCTDARLNAGKVNESRGSDD